MTDPTQTPADLDVLAERWCRLRGIDSTWQRQSLAALLRSVREEGARQAEGFVTDAQTVMLAITALRDLLSDDPEDDDARSAFDALRQQCAARGHHVVDDHCGRPEHRYCITCGEPTPAADPTP